tara:strand:- start:320 stop:715 length:396 start_codon:yes stop_codon:yes gene_type:complete
MGIYRNNNSRRSNFRRNDRNFRRNGDNSKFKSNFSSHDTFQRKIPGRNNINASKLIDKYNDLAREALANEDKILSESYFQYADHFMRILKEQEKNRAVKSSNENTKNVVNNEESALDLKDKKTSEKQIVNS